MVLNGKLNYIRKENNKRIWIIEKLENNNKKVQKKRKEKGNVGNAQSEED